MSAHRLVREPLLHFLVIGALMFAAFALFNRDALRAPTEIVVDNDRVVALRSQFERVWQRAPTDNELAGLIDGWVREEMLYREGLTLGFETDDPVIRRRVVQKVEFLTDALVDDRVTDEQLGEWLAARPDDYRLEPRLTFRQVYFDPRRHGDNLAAVIEAAATELAGNPNATPGDVTLLPEQVELRPASDIARTFGSAFADVVTTLPESAGFVRVPSGFGEHLVRVDAKVDGRDATLDEVRSAVERDLLADRRRRAEEDFLDALRERYVIVTDDDVTALASSSR